MTNFFGPAMQNFELTQLEETWRQGRNPASPWDGTHFAVPGTPRPLTVSRTEARFLANLAALSDTGNVLEIGTGFGYSSAWLAHGLHMSGRGEATVYTVDNFSEGDRRREHLGLAKRMWADCGVQSRIRLLEGDSPDVLNQSKLLDVSIVFLDGEHRGSQPLLDYQGATRHLRNDGIIIFHDVQPKYDVKHAVDQSVADGFALVDLNTSCQPVAACRSDAAIRRVEAALLLARHGLLAEADGWAR